MKGKGASYPEWLVGREIVYTLVDSYPNRSLNCSPLMSTERGSKKRKTRCSGIELVSAFHVLQRFREKIKTEDLVEPDDRNLESVELDMEVDKDALAQLDGLLEWMNFKIKGTKKVCPGLLVRLSFTLARATRVRQLDTRERHPDHPRTTTFSQR
jgi:hypothetical protein